ncbi:two-component regulator propeller domain-containing protein [Parabacteroides segnis]|uniref:ligand-binding sensor domain-containing protein n=1 Tax=Parabacteroides segnis TaxID=2763058 RepID=UPI0035133A01
MTKNTLVLFLLFLFPYLFQSANSKNTTPYFFSQIGVEDGLTQSTVTNIYQDTDGYLWLGTQGGLHRYDGYEFKVFKNNPTDSCTLTDNNIQDIGEDRHKNIWVITYNGVHKIMHQTEKVKRYSTQTPRDMHCCMRSKEGNFLLAGEKKIYQYDEQGDSLICKDWLSSIPGLSGIKALQEDEEGNLYVATAHSGLVVLDKQKKVIHHYKHNPKDPSSFIKGTIHGLFTDSRKRLWITSETSGLCYLDKKQERFVHVTAENSDLNSNVIRAIAEPEPGTLLLGTFTGLNDLDMETLKVTPYKFIPDEPGALGYYSIHSILKDNTGALWVGTWKGLNYYSPAKKQFYLLTPNEFTGLLGMGKEDRDGNIWFATEGSGLFCYNPQTREQQIFPKRSPYKSNYNDNIIKSLFIKGDSILCATHEGAVYLFSRKKKDYQLLYDYEYGDIYSLLIDSKDRLWIPTNSNKGLFLIDKGKPVNQFKVNGKNRKFYYVTTLKETEPDVFVMGTLTQNLYRYDLQKENLKIISSPDLNLKEDVKPGSITGIQTDSLHNIWVSFFGSGIYRFDSEMNLIKQYTETDGITDNYIYTIICDRNKHLWALSEKTLYCYNTQTDKFSPIHNDGRQALEFTQMAGTVDNNGTLYFPGNKGILCFNPVQITSNTFTPPVYLTSLYINNNPVEFENTNELELKANETNISIGYTAPDFIAPKQNQYAYKMDGVEKEWNYVGQRRMAYYNNLAPGTYNLKVKVANSDGIWNPQEAVLRITVMPPLYKTWWAYALYFIVITTIIWKFIYHQKVRHELESNIRFKQMEQEKMKELHEERMRLFTNFSHELCHFSWTIPTI